ncbi:hypothetical protein BD311DRAFT_781459 [Dichomitus squalens]|uniref:Uncharacterized protein n=1 Tax=Dichomitus squalens TaxID=114155 RepID=A0A4Q9M9D7_9APHY|nr:hypothetical protein BD311DRAFT_781459 [Dichomitus squalens]
MSVKEIREALPKDYHLSEKLEGEAQKHHQGRGGASRDIEELCALPLGSRNDPAMRTMQTTSRLPRLRHSLSRTFRDAAEGDGSRCVACPLSGLSGLWSHTPSGSISKKAAWTVGLGDYHVTASY